MEEKEKLSEVYKQLRHYCKADNLEQWAAENNRPIIDETIALIKEIVETGAETLLVSSELRKVQQSLANQEITQAEYDTNPYKQAFDKYAGKTFYQIRKLANVCLLQTILPLKKIPPYKKAADKAIKKAEVIIKRICKETNCNDETRLFLAEDLVRNVSYKAYIVYYPEKLIQHSEWFKEIALRINNVMAQITKPATDPKNDKYYNERDQLLNELEEGTRLYNNGIYQYNKADRIAADIISRLYPEQVIDQNIMRTERDNKLYFTLPSTSTTKIMKQILNNPTRVRTTKRGQIKQNKLLLTGDSTITYKGNDSTVTLTLERTRELFTKKIQNGAKVFNFFLQKLNEQHRREITTFQLSELVENGAYANKDSAYRGLKSILNKIYAISIEGIATEYNGRKKQEKAFAKSRIVSTFDVTYNSCHVSLTPIIRENMPYITLLPKWSYKLNENGYMLLDYISILARQNAEQIKQAGYFNIGLETVRAYMGLPTPEEAGDDPKRLIFEPIEKAITEIEEKQEGTAFKITPSYDTEYKNIHSYLAGYLKIELDQPMQDSLTLIANRQEKEYKLEQNRIEKAKQKAAESTIK